MVLEISSAVLDAILAESARSPGREICGLLFGSATRIEGHQSCRNVAADPRDSFEIDPAQLIVAHKAARGGGAQIVGCYHSHPGGSAVPSARDAAAAVPDGSLWLIVAGREAGMWRAVAAGKYEGRFDEVALSLR